MSEVARAEVSQDAQPVPMGRRGRTVQLGASLTCINAASRDKDDSPPCGAIAAKSVQAALCIMCEKAKRGNGNRTVVLTLPS